ncbi:MULTISPECIES: hypothetical protein [Streptomyces]|uniref:hypothetical protein n=1 Tax=Streptomyces TaxID=1883 RepID=UPI001CCAB9CD|nr:MULTISPECIES: hypothetical protein [Streptomyces]UBI41372.1 hypothetical protein K7I03_06915 [Streptomyces mobaraensis]UKW33869.1 hypothetical protein MCU78_06900 [Streptomyces sp. TYQ1024]
MTGGTATVLTALGVLTALDGLTALKVLTVLKVLATVAVHMLAARPGALGERYARGRGRGGARVRHRRVGSALLHERSSYVSFEP